MKSAMLCALAVALTWACASTKGETNAPLDVAPTLDAKTDSASPVYTDSENPADSHLVGEDSATPEPEGSWHAPCPVDEREQRMIKVGDISLNVACRGSGPTVVFLHGFPEFHYSWNKVMDELVDEYRLIAPDQRGYNISDKPAELEAYELPHLVNDIVTLLPLISPDPVILVAHDWGGPVGWTVAHHPDAFLRGFISTNGPHPVRFAELIANDPEQKAASSYMAMFRAAAAESYLSAEALMAGYADLLSDEEKAIYEEALNQPGAITGGLNWYRANDLDPEKMASIMEGFSPTVSVPATVMWGLDDEFVLPQNAEGLEVYAPDLVVETFPGVDHWIEHRIPDEIARVIRDLDARIEAQKE